MKKTVGFYGGSFDPVHFGHINLAIQLLEIHQLQSILFCPAFCSPHKISHPPVASPIHRLNMLKAALSETPQFQTTAIEVERGGISYTIETIRELREKGLEIRLILSEEAAAHLDRWKEHEELVRLAPPLIGGRKGISSSRSSLPDPLKKGFTPTRIMEISSTEIRDRMNKKLYCGHLVPAKALDYIHSHKLYSS